MNNAKSRAFRRLPLGAFSLAVLFVAASGGAQAQSDPPARVGRLAFTEGSVSFHDQDDSGWSKAVVNTPLTSGDAVWTEPNARSELSVAGTRVRLDGGTQLDLLTIDDSRTRLQVDQGRLDIKTFTLDTQTPYQIVTPRGTITLQQQGDYYVEAGSTQDATRLGVRSGAAQIQGLNGQTLAVRAGEVGEIDGDSNSPQLRTVHGAPPPQVDYWTARDKAIGYDSPPQYLSTGMTGYEDLSASGTWSSDSEYGQVWTPRSVSSDWQPYRTGHWSNVKPWGWTWIDDQPWGYAPYHYGRWAQRNNRWVWVPPQREAQPVYAPALVAFIGGIELSLSLGNQGNAPVGWFPLAPRETYVPSYTSDRAYYNRINRADQVQQAALDDRWQRAQRHEPAPTGATVSANQRFAVVVPADTFVRSQPVARAALKVAPEKIAAAPVAPVAAPPASTASLSANVAAKPADAKAEPKPATAPVAANPPASKTAVADMPTLAKPATAEKPAAPGPKIATAPATTPAPATAAPGAPAPAATATTSTRVDGKAAPSLQPRTGAPPPKLSGATTPATPTAAPPATHTPATAPATAPTTAPATPPAKPAEASKPEASKPEASKPEASKPEATKPAEPAKTAAPAAAPPAPPQARTAPPTPAPAAAPHDATKEAPKPPVREAQPDRKVPDVKAPDVKAPDVKAPEAKAPELRVPGAKTPELAKVPDVDTKPALPATAPVVEEKKDEKK